MKRFISILLVASLVFTMGISAFADTQNSKTAAELIVFAKAKFSISDDEFVFKNYNHSETKNGTRYYLNWESKDETKSSSINVEVGENKTIYNYNFYDGTKKYGQLKYPAHIKEAAMRAAKEHFAVIDAEKNNQVVNEKTEYNSYDNSYTYTAQRAKDGIPVFGESVSITVDADNLKLLSYYANWNEKLIFNEGEAISIADARTAYREKIGYELFYQVVSRDYADTVKLVYRPKYDETLYIDAISGEAVDYEMISDDLGGSREEMKDSASGSVNSAIKLSKEEQEMVDKIAKMLSKDKAEEIARNIKEFNITKDYEAESFNIYRNASGKYIGQINLRLDSDGSKYGYRNVSIDAMSGEVISFGGYTGGDETYTEKKTLTVEEIQKKAETFLNKYYKEKFAKMQPKNRFSQEIDRAEYQLIYDGVRVYNNGASVYIDTNSGEMRSFNLNCTDASFPDKNVAAELDKVYDKVLSDDNFRLGYLKVYDKETKENKAVLVYAVENNMILSADTLDELDWSLEPIREKEEFSYNDLCGHYSEDAAQKLLLMDISYDEKILRADDSVLQKDYLKLIARAVLNRSFIKADEDFYNYMIRQGVLDKADINPDAPITRISGVKYLLNALGYAEFAGIEGIFNCPFRDVAESDKGYGALAAGLGLVYSGTDTFSAEANLKRGDALIIIYNYLKR